VRHLLTTLFFLLPPSGLKNRLLNRVGHDIHPSARIGICLAQRVDRFELAEGVRIGNWNAFRFLARVQMGRGSRIVMFNWILGGSGFEPGEDHRGVRRTLRMGNQSHIISFHFLDCGGGLLLADNCWITGIRSTVLSHAFDPRSADFILEPVELKKGGVVASNCTLLPGSVVGEGAVVAAGSAVWTGQELQPAHLHGGVPARRLAPIEVPDAAYERQGPLG
jgi:acetyltransferase-like isoleucine patch superfamily enzyme